MDENIDLLNEKYAPLLDDLRRPDLNSIFSNAIECSIEFLNKTNESPYWKALTTLVLIRILESKPTNDMDVIVNIINEFLDFKTKKYDKYCNDIVVFSSAFDNDLEFCYVFIYKKIKTNEIQKISTNN